MKDKDEQIAMLEARLDELDKWIASDSVYTLLRYGSKSPSSSGVDDCEEEQYYMDLYNHSSNLRKAAREANEAAKDAFEQKQP